MNRKIHLLFVIFIFSIAAYACSPATLTEPPSPTVPVTVKPTPTVSGQIPLTEAEVPRVSLDETIAAVQSGEAIIVDVRSLQAFQASHIPGSVSIPLAEIETNPTGLSLDKDQWIITYCT